ncbi:MAG: helicase-related protein [Bdellovibrionota bacterium]
MAWKKDQLVWVEADQSLGASRIVDDSDASFLTVQSLESGDTRNYTKRNPPFKRVNLDVGQKLKVKRIESEVLIRKIETRVDIYHFETDEGSFSESDIVALSVGRGVLDLVRQRQLSHPKLFALRRDAWGLLEKRSFHPLRGAIGCRVQLLPHQLWVLESCLKMPQLRALLADEVGLGKTIEAGLVFSALHARHKLKKVLVLVPPALKVQWLTESFRRFNIRFRLDHDELIEEDEFRDFIIASLDEVSQNIADFDLLIVDEAHRLVHDPLRSEDLRQLVSRAKHVLFLSATPRVHGDAEFLKMIKILGTVSESSVVPWVFQSRRAELGLPTYRQLEAAIVPDKKKWLFDFVEKCLAAPKKEKLFLISSQAKDVIALCSELRAKFGENFALFHEEMDLVERDRQAAYFSEPDGAPILVSSEIGGEGRNFQFCHHMVLLDLPRDPLIIEQRIGRLDRLGQTQTVHVWCPVLEDSPEEDSFEMLRDRFRVFAEPWSGSGLEDMEDGEALFGSATGRDLSTLQESGNFIKVSYDPDAADRLMDEADDLGETEIRDFLDRLYDLFGIEVEDFDTRGNWKVAISSLMFVDYFPGLGEKGERILSFDRAQALAREDMSFFSLDHPDFVESIEFLLNSDHGKLAMTMLPKSSSPDILFWGLMETLRSGHVREKLWSCFTKRGILVNEKFLTAPETVKIGPREDAFLKALPQPLGEFLEAQDGRGLDSLLILIPG